MILQEHRGLLCIKEWHGDVFFPLLAFLKLSLLSFTSYTLFVFSLDFGAEQNVSRTVFALSTENGLFLASAWLQYICTRISVGNECAILSAANLHGIEMY